MVLLKGKVQGHSKKQGVGIKVVHITIRHHLPRHWYEEDSKHLAQWPIWPWSLSLSRPILLSGT